MSKEEQVVSELVQKFPFLEGKCTVIRTRRITVEVNRLNMLELMDFAKTSLKFDFLCTITGLDIGENLQFIYHIANNNGILINIKTETPKSDPVIKTVTGIYNGAGRFIGSKSGRFTGRQALSASGKLAERTISFKKRLETGKYISN
jgi:NADH:ubiquinone oxidoreductase subunit C